MAKNSRLLVLIKDPELLNIGLQKCFVNRTGNKLVITNIDLVKD